MQPPHDAHLAYCIRGCSTLSFCAPQNLQIATELQVAEALLLLPGATVAMPAAAAPPSTSGAASPATSRASSIALGSAPTTPVTGRAGAGIISPFRGPPQVRLKSQNAFA